MQTEPAMSQLKEHFQTQQNKIHHAKTVEFTETLSHRFESDSDPQPGIEQQIPLSPKEQNLIHAVSRAASDYKQSESILVLRFCELAKTQAFKKCGYPNLFTFAVKHLGLTEGTAYLLVKVAKKSKEIPLLIQEINTSKLSLRAVGRLVPVLTAENAAAFFARARTMTSRELERLVATLNPRAVRRDHRSVLNSEDTRVSVTLNQAEMADLIRCQELLMQKSQGALSLAEVVAALAADYLKRHSPEQKAARAEARRRKNSCQERPTTAHPEDQSRRKNSHKAMSAAAASTKSQSQQRPGQLPTKAASHKKSKKDCHEKGLTSPANSHDQLPRQAPAFTVQEITPNPKNPRLVPASIVRFVGQRDHHRCTHVNPAGERCGEKKFLHLHHIKLLSEGGNHHPENLTQLCAYHHDLAHQLSFAGWVER